MIKKIIIKYRFQFFLSIVMAIGLWLRFYNLPDQVWSQSGYDESRDMLVAEHIYKYKESINRGPLAAGGLGQLKNSPVYYYLIAMLWALASNPTSFMYLWATILAGQILLAYLIGKKLGDETSGIITSIVFAINNQLIYQSRQLLQPHLLPVFSLLFLWILLKNKEKKSIIFILLMIFLLLFPLHIHYGVLIIFPAGCFWISYFWSEILEEKISIKNIFLPIITAVGLIFSWIIATYRKKVFDQILFFTTNFTKSNISFLEKINQLLTELTNSFIPSFSLFWAILFIIFFTILSFFWLKKKYSRSGIINWAIICSFSFSTLLAVLFSGRIANTYLLSSLPFFLILLSLGLRQLISINKLFGLIIVGWILYFLYIPTNHLLFFNTPAESFRQQNYKIAKLIYRDSIKNNQDKKQPINFGIASLSTIENLPFDGWATSGIWFYLEKLFDQKLIKLTSIGVSHSPLIRKINDLYFICDHRVLSERINESCLNRFTKNRNYLVDYPKKIYQSQNYTVWKTKINPKKNPGSYYKVYRDLL